MRDIAEQIVPQTRSVKRCIGRFKETCQQLCDDAVTAEEPLEIRIGREPVAVVMRTPCDDFDLVAGFLYTEGIVQRPEDIGALSYCASAEPPNERNVVEVHLAPEITVDWQRLKRNLYASSSCGICGKASIDAVRTQAAPITAKFTVPTQTLYGLDACLRQAQAVFEATGSLHAAGIFNTAGELLVLREDVGRHNAVDKAVGSFMLDGRLPPAHSILMVSGRTSFEIIQKALVAGIAFVAAVSAPSSLAVDLALEANMTLVGFLRGRGFNVYAGAERIVP
jgi:FdhD protein